MYRASTPTHYFRLPYAPEEIKEIWLTYSQSGANLLRKTMDELTYKDGVWSIRLTQEETNKFSDVYATAQIRVLLNNGDSFPSEKFRLVVHDVLDDEVMA
jgi:hypothetical protein